MRAKNIGKTFDCQDCDKKFNRVDALDMHRKQVHDEPYVSECKDCKSKFKSFPSWVKHRRANYDAEGKPEIICPECEAEFCSPKFLKQHIKKKHGRLECKDCNEKFTRKTYLDAHISRNKVTCDACCSVFCNQRQLILHKAASHNKPKVSCGQCGKKFSQKWLLDRHRKAASKYECEDCDLTYCNVQDLISHNYHQHKCIKCTIKFVLKVFNKNWNFKSK